VRPFEVIRSDVLRANYGPTCGRRSCSSCSRLVTALAPNIVTPVACHPVGEARY